MAKVEKVTLKLQTQGFAGIKNIGQDFKKFSSTVKVTKPQLDRFIKGITKVHGNAKLSKTAFEGQISALTKLRNNVGIGTVAYKKLGVELDKVKAKLKSVTAAAAPQGGMFARLNARFQKIPVGGRAALGALAGTATAGLGSTGQLAFAGGAVGGAPGALIGAGLGAAMDVGNFASGAATYASEIQKLEIALAGVTKDQETFEYGLNVIATTSRELNVPIAASTKQFTTLAASVLGAGGTIQNAETVFTGVSNAIKATGGNAEDVQSAIRAMSQIFGKGKVSAEELQGQLGERLAGAVVKFAEANGSSLQKLQKDLRDGVVGLDQIMNFAERLNEDFAETAKEVANSSADAGQKLKTSINLFKLAVGKSVLPIGAAFQKAFSDITLGILQSDDAMKIITVTLKALGAFLYSTFALLRLGIRILVDLSKILYYIANFDFKKAMEVASQGITDMVENAKKDFKALSEMTIKPPKIEGADGDPTIPKGLGDLGDEDSSPLKAFAESAFKFAEQAEQAVVNAFKGMEDALVKFVLTGKLNFTDLANSIIADLTRMFVRFAIVKPLFKMIFPGIDITDSAKGNVFNKGEVVPSAKGNVFAKNKIVPYAKGGTVVRKPTIFPMANGGIGLMAEAGYPEAIMPLKRTRQGKLGVEASGGGGNVVNVSVNASGTSAQGNTMKATQLGKMIGTAIEAELIKQKRPGGILYS